VGVRELVVGSAACVTVEPPGECSEAIGEKGYPQQ